MAGGNNNIGILISSKINEEESIDTINNQLKTMSNELNKLNINIDLSKLENSFNNIFKSIDSVNKLTEQLNKSNIQHEEILKKVNQSTRNIVDSNKQVTESIKEQNKALREQDGLAKRQLKYDSEGRFKSGRDTYKQGNLTEVNTYNKDGLILGSSITKNIEKENKEIAKLTQERKVLLDKLNNLKQTEQISKDRLNEVEIKINKSSLNELKFLKDEIKSLEQVSNEMIKNQQLKATLSAKQEQDRLKLQNELEMFKRESENVKLKNLERRYGLDSVDQNKLNDYVKSVRELNIDTPNLKQRMKELNLQFRELGETVKESGSHTLGFSDAMLTALKRFPIWVATANMIYAPIRAMREMTSVVIEVDTAMTDLIKVMNEDTDFSGMLRQATSDAKDLGKTITDVLNGYNEFAKQGYNEEETKALGKSAIVASNVSGDLDTQQSAEYLTAAMIQFQLEAEKSMLVVDKWNELSNNFPTTFNNLARGVARAGSVAKSFGMDIDELNAIIGTVTASTKQSGDEIGNFVKFVLPRLQSSDSARALDSLKVSLTDDNGEMRNAFDVYSDVAKAIQNVSSAQRNSIAEALAGKHHISRMLVMLDNWDMVENQLASSIDARGSAMQENEVYMNSIEAKINIMKAKFEELAITIGEAFLSDGMILFFDILGSGITLVTKIVSTIGFLPSVIGATSLSIIAFKTLMSDTAKEVITFDSATKKLSFSIENLGKTAKGFGKSILASAGQIAIVMGIFYAIEKVTSAIQKQREETKKLKQENDQSAKSYDKNSEKIDELVKDYDRLDSIRKTTGLSIEQEREYYDVQKKLVELMPSLKDGENAKGDARAKSVEATKEEIKSQKEYLKLLEEEKYLKAKKEVSKYEGKMQDVELGKSWDILGLRRTALDINQISGGRMFKGTRENADLEEKKIQQDTAKAIEKKVSYQKELNKHQKAYIKNLSQEGLSQGKSTKDVEKKAEKIAKIMNEYGKTANSIFGSALSSDESLKFSNKQIDVMEDLIKKTKEGKYNYDDFVNSLVNAGVKMEDAILIVNGLAESQDKASKSAENHAMSLEELTNKLNEAEESMNLLGSAQRELDEEGRLSTETLLKLLEVYPDLVEATGLETDAIYDFIGAKKLETAESIKAERERTKNKIEETQKRIEATRTEIVAMQEMMMGQYVTKNKKGIYELTDKAKGDKYKKDVDKIQGMYNSVNKATEELKKLEAQSAVLEYSQENLNKSYNDASGATEKAEKATKEYEKAQEELNETVEDTVEVIQESIFILNEYEEKLRVIDNALRKVQTTQNRYAKSSELYRKSIKQEIDLIEKKINALKAQEKQIRNDISSGNIHPYGVVSKSSVNYTAGSGITDGGSIGFGNKKVTSNYGMRGGKMHHGVDLAYGANEQIRSNINGTVVYSGWGQPGSGYGGYGNVVAVRDTSGNVHVYGHMNKVSAGKGTSIKKGDLLGLAGNTGNSQGNHLHYEIRKGGQLYNTIDPSQYVKGFNAPPSVQSSGSSLGAKSTLSSNVKYASIIAEASAKYGIPANIIAGLIQTESGFNPNAKSHAGAMGLTQLMPGTARSLGVSNAYDPYENIMGGTKYLKQMIDQFGDMQKALSAYNMGPGNQQKGRTNYSYANKVLTNAQKYGQLSGGSSGSSATNKFNGVDLPFNEWYQTEADYQSALYDAKVQADEIGISIEELYTQLAELEYRIVESRILEYEKAVEKYDIDLNYWQKMAEGVNEYSLKGLEILNQEVNLIEAKKSKYSEIMDYINNEISTNSKLNDYYREELRNSYNTYLKEFRDMEAMILEMNRRKEKIQFENYYRLIEERLNYLKKEMNKLDNQIAMTEEDDLAEIIKLSKEKYIIAERENKYIKETIQSLRVQYNQYKDNYELADNINERIKEWEDSLESSSLELYNMQKNIKSLYENLADQLIDQMKSYYQTIKDREQQMYDERKKKMQEEHEKRMENLDKEMTKYEKYAQMQIRTMERTEQQESYEKQLKKMQDERQKIQNLYNELLMDTSLEGEKRRKELAEDLKNRDEEISEFMRNRESELIKQDINDRLEKEQERYNATKEKEQKKYEEDIKKVEEEQKERAKYWQYLIDSEREWNKIREQIVQGDLDSVQRNVEMFKQNVEKLSQTTVDNLEVVIDGLNGKITVMTDGMSLAIQENLIDQLKETIDLMNEIEGKRLGGYNDLSGIEDSITPVTQDDLNLMVGKFIMNELYRSADTQGDKKYFEQMANQYISKAGGKSKFNDMDYRDIVGKLSNEEKILFAKYLQENTSGINDGFYKQMVNSYAVDMINRSSYGQGSNIKALKFDEAFKKYMQIIASGKIAKFDKGGYTGNWDGGYGKLGVLHPRELILNEDNTTTLLDTLKEIKYLKPIIDKIKSPTPNIENNVNQVVNVNMKIDKVTGDENGAKQLLRSVANGLKGKGVVKFV